MNILIIPSFLFSKYDVTLGSFFFEQAIALKQAGHTVTILYCDTYSIKDIRKYLCYEEERLSEKDGITIIRDRCLCPLKHSSGFKGCKESFANGIIRLYRKYLSDKHFDVIHAHCCAWAGYAAYKLSDITHTLYCITEHSTLYALHPELITKDYRRIIALSFEKAKKVICVSEALARIISEYCNDISIIGNVIDCNMFSIVERAKEDNAFIFLSVCYLKDIGQINKKGIDLLIEAFAKLTEIKPEAKLYIGGGGEGLSILRGWISDLGLQNNVVLLGELSRSEVAEQMKNCDAFVLPSRYETFGVVYAEAMACGKPVIGTRTGGPDSFLRKEAGILIDIGNKEQLLKAMIYLMDHKNEYDGRAIRKIVEDTFSMHAIADCLEKVYRS